jgi:hypothetical protein
LSRLGATNTEKAGQWKEPNIATLKGLTMYPIGSKPLTQAMFHSMFNVMTDQSPALFPLNQKNFKFLLSEH